MTETTHWPETHFLNRCSYEPAHQHARIAIARVLTEHGIDNVVWAEDALAIIHNTPTGLFTLQLLVRDNQVALASEVISRYLPYNDGGRDPDWFDFRLVKHRNGDSYCYPKSKCLVRRNASELDSMEWSPDPKNVHIHPQSFFHFDMDSPRSIVKGSDISDLPPSDANVRFPTRGAFADALIESLLYHPSGDYNFKLHTRLQTFLAYLTLYSLKEEMHVTNTGDLTENSTELLLEVSEENRPFLESKLRMKKGMNVDEYREKREAIVRQKAMASSEVSHH